ncbi:hypothetical protein HXX76_009280 [Chlamydomonas incerta]|uniref:Calpain catalytic domain-containing protein n=1 Tax=Chlamydomonas incerta TaxID=51695 RepID=A0A835SRB8_CHLIN|nr:hypothetical protein HXX76_009280 [Chlamydomonas incerta]|eukprot:KAG2431784.1 hypothetical protein HXX76_009280 [Chlamydomonas incerta]
MPFALIVPAAGWRDSDFKAEEQSVLEIEVKGRLYQGRDVARVVDWRRLKDLPSFARATDGKTNVRLFEDGVHYQDINQGSLGNCWLLSSLACLATRSGAIERLFLTPEYNEDGRYQLRLWDKGSRQFKEVVVDDYIPVWRQNGGGGPAGQPCFARPAGNEAWVLLLEKAMAKAVGNYHYLNGGMASWALETLTGHYTCVFLLERRYGPNRDAGPDQANWKWIRGELAQASKHADRIAPVGESKPSPLNRAALYVLDEKDPAKFYAHEELFMAMSYHLAIGNLVAAATVGTDDDEEVNGVVRAHAYTVLKAQPVESSGRGQVLLVQLRNPHGEGGIEWGGDWSDKSTLWAKHPEVAEAVGYTPPASLTSASARSDGLFWMEWKDFILHFKEVTFCCANGFDYIEDEAAGWVEVFNDPGFPHDYRSLGDYKFIYNNNPMTGQQLDEIIKWMRLKEIAAPEQFRKGTRGLKLFTGGGTHPDDIDGSSSGLMVAVACLANKPGAIEEMFLAGKEYRPDGSYQIRLYDPKSGGATISPIDDWIPCFNGNSITKTKILGNEVWVLLLEKAVARMVSSYSKVAMWGVQVCWALAALTGEYSTMLMWAEDKQKWRRLELQYIEKEPGKYRAEYAADDVSLYVSDDVFKAVTMQLALGCLMAAETDKGEAVDPEATGLARGRNYSVLDARFVAINGTGGVVSVSYAATVPPPGGRNLRLIKLRDPARTNEWKGDWSDASAQWDTYAGVAEALEFRREGGGGGGEAGTSGRRDGSFWMSFEDFLRHFRNVTMCGNSLKGNQKPWVARPEDIDRAGRRLWELRKQQELRAEQEALEDSLHAELRKKAVERSNAPSMGHVFAQAAITASANAPKRELPPPPPPPPAVAAGAAAAAAAAAGAGAGAAAAAAPAAKPAAQQQNGEGGNGAGPAAAGAAAAGGAAAAAGAAANKPPVVVVEYKGCKACSIM